MGFEIFCNPPVSAFPRKLYRSIDSSPSWRATPPSNRQEKLEHVQPTSLSRKVQSCFASSPFIRVQCVGVSTAME